MGEVIPTRVRLTFLQAQNMIADIAIERNYTFFFWGHSDVALLASNATALFAEEVSLHCLLCEAPRLLCVIEFAQIWASYLFLLIVLGSGNGSDEVVMNWCCNSNHTFVRFHKAPSACVVRSSPDVPSS